MQVFISIIRVLALLIIGFIVGTSLMAMSSLGQKLKDQEVAIVAQRAKATKMEIEVLNLRNKILSVSNIQDEKARKMAFDDLVYSINKDIQEEVYNRFRSLEEEAKPRETETK